MGDEHFDKDEWGCVLDHAVHVLTHLPTMWGPSTFPVESEAIQKAFLLLLQRGLARCRIEGQVTRPDASVVTVTLEVWDGFNPLSLLSAFREAAGADESAEVSQCIRQWSLTTLGLAKRDCLSWDDLHQRNATMQWRVVKPKTPSEPVKSADTGADTPKIKSPISPDVSAFIAYLKRVKPPKGKETAAARDFCQKTGLPSKKANGLIRGARRYPELW